MRIMRAGKPVKVLQVGDHDNSGLSIRATNQERLIGIVEREALRFGLPVPDIAFEDVAVLEEHIAQYNLPTRPQKADNRGALHVVDRAVDIDAMDPYDVQALLAKALRRYMPDARLAAHEVADAAMRAKMERRVRRFRG